MMTKLYVNDEITLFDGTREIIFLHNTCSKLIFFFVPGLREKRLLYRQHEKIFSDPYSVNPNPGFLMKPDPDAYRYLDFDDQKVNNFRV